jgi:hypothetical protein
VINIIVKNKYIKVAFMTAFTFVVFSGGSVYAAPDDGALTLNQDQQNILSNMATQACASSGGGSADAAERNKETCLREYRTKSSNQAAAIRIFNTCQSKKADASQYLTCISDETKTIISTQSNTASPSGETYNPEPIKSDCKDADLNESNCGIIKYLKIAINTLSAVAGVVIVGSVIFAGIQYSASADDPQAVAKAKGRIINALIALLFFTLGYGVINWLIPGGVL